MNFLNLFPVPLCRFDYLPPEVETNKIIDYFLEIESKDRNTVANRYTDGSYTSFYSQENIINLNLLEQIKSFMSNSVRQVHSMTGLTGNLSFTQSWFNINRKHSYHEQHHHCPNIWSGVYYLKASEEDATISFINKNLLDVSWPYKAKKEINTDYNSTQTVCKVKSGMLLIFPSYLHHKVDQHVSNNERISIAFNMDII